MENILEFIKTDYFIISMIILNILFFILIVANSIKLSKTKNNYNKFMKKLGNGTNIEEILKKYIERVEEINEENNKIINYCKKIDNDLTKCIQKIGIIRYNAFKDTGSDLSFTLAMLNENNDGVVLNGIYSREMSNIYAKPINNGKSEYTLSEEENQAIEKAIKSNGIYKINE